MSTLALVVWNPQFFDMQQSGAYWVGAIVGAVSVMGLGAFGLFSIVMAFVKKTALWITLASITLVVGLGLAAVGAYFGIQEVKKANLPKPMIASDGSAQVTVPGSWGVMKELNAEAKIACGNRFSEHYCMLMEEEAPGMTQEDYAKALREVLQKDLNAPGEIELKSFTTTGGLDGVTFDIAGKADGVRITFHLAVFPPREIGGKTVIQRLHQWTLSNRFASSKPQFVNVAKSYAVMPAQ
jgi:hypothetical protein